MKQFIGMMGVTLIFLVLIPVRLYAAEEDLQIIGNKNHIIHIGQTVDLATGVMVVGEGAENYTFIIDDSQVNYSSPGVYIVNYYLSPYRPKLSVTSYIVVLEKVQKDNSPPHFIGYSDFDVILNEEPTNLLRLTQAYDEDKDITDRIIFDDSSINYGVVGNYPLRYIVADETGNVESVEVTVNVIEMDRIKPQILGLEDHTITVHTPFDLWKNITAIDNVSGDLTSKIEIDASQLKVDEVGTYTITYEVSDDVGNHTVETITVNVVDDLAPSIDLVHNLKVIRGSTPQLYNFFSITDNYDTYKDLIIEFKTEKVDLERIGNYELEVIVKDRSNNINKQKFQIYVYDTQEPKLIENPYLVGSFVAIIVSVSINFVFYLFTKHKK